MGMTKPREFWITKRELRDYKAHLTLSSVESTVRNASPNFEIEIFKVVEVSALEALQTKLDIALEALESIAATSHVGLDLETYFFGLSKDELAECVCHDTIEAREALAKIEGDE